jgi:L-rhamnose-H+ transport protein
MLAPMRVIKQWEWENIWIVYSLVGLFILPLLVALWTVPHYWQVNQEAGLTIVALTLFFGAICGMSGFLYSMTIRVLGLGLATALNGGSSMALALLPLFMLHRKTFLHASGMLTLLGVGLSIVGLSLCSKGGSLREKNRANPEHEAPGKAGKLTFVNCVIACCVAGAISSGMNVVLALPFLNLISNVAHKYGSSDFGAANAFLAPYLIGGAFSNFVYAARVLRRNGTFARFFVPGALRCAIWSVVIGSMFVFGATSYTGAVGLLGTFGAVVTWGVSMAAMILISSLWDLSLGEWKGQPLKFMALGIGILMIAIVALSYAEYFHQTERITRGPTACKSDLDFRIKSRL